MSGIRRGFGKALAGAALALIVALPLGAVGQGRPREVIYNFTGGAEGGVPHAGLIRDTAGNFYGVTTAGGNNICSAGCGAVFKLSPLGVVTVLHGFSGSDGGRPYGKLIADAAGNLYGTTALGGAHGHGVVFKLTPGGVETVLYAFAGGNDGAAPTAGVIMDGAGNFYGTTTFGGGTDGGTVFKLAPDGTETVLHAFTRFAHHDGFNPYGGVIMDKHGALFGAAANHGPKFKSGRIFKIAPNGKFSVLYSFTGGADGGVAASGLIMDKQGNLYGVTGDGGALRLWRGVQARAGRHGDGAT